MDEDRIVRCKYCGEPEYDGERRWLSGRCLCRSCYKEAYELEYGKAYSWYDLEGPRPSREDYLEQEVGLK